VTAWYGDLPAGWRERRVKHIFREVTNLSTDGDETLLSVSEYFGVKPRAEIIAEGEFLSRAESFVGYKRVQVGDLAMNIMLAWKTGLGFSAFDGIISPAYSVFRLTEPSCNPWYFNYLLRSRQAVDEFHRWSYGIMDSRLRLYPTVFMSLCLPVPPVHVQDVIVDYLDAETSRIDALIERKQRFIELLLEKRTALIAHAVTKGLDPNVEMQDSEIPFLGEVPRRWDVAPLYARYDVTLGKMLDAKQITGDYLAPYLRNADVQWDYVNVDDLDEMDFDPSAQMKFRLRVGDLLVCEGGEVGRTAMWRGELDECYYQKAIHRLRPRSSARDVPRFFYYTMLASAMGERFTVGSNVATIGHLTATQLRHHRFAFPPVDEQRRIVDFLDTRTTKLDGLVHETRKSIDLLKEYRTALISAAVTGQIEIPATDPGEDVA